MRVRRWVLLGMSAVGAACGSSLVHEEEKPPVEGGGGGGGAAGVGPMSGGSLARGGAEMAGAAGLMFGGAPAAGSAGMAGGAGSGGEVNAAGSGGGVNTAGSGGGVNTGGSGGEVNAAGSGGGVNTGGSGGGVNTGGSGGGVNTAGSGGEVNTAGSGGEVNTAGSGGEVNTAGGGGGPAETPCVPGQDALGVDLPIQVVPKPLPTAAFTLTRDKAWVLEDVTVVDDGQVLTIEPCTKIVGSPAPKGSLVVARGGKLMPKGTANEPIVFTSALPPGARSSGQWGGVILLGRAATNKGTDVQIEGLPPNPAYQFGGGAPNDSSGELEYVRIEFGGVEVSVDNEINGLTMGGVGSGTLISHIMVKSNLDDCFEWFGGTVNASYLVAENCGDDMFDADQGFSGTIDTHFGRQRLKESANPHGYELDSDTTLADLAPTTTATFKNGTICGLNAPGGATAFGAIIRTMARPTMQDLVILGFDQGFDLRDNVGTLASPRVTWTNSFLRNRLFDTRDPAELDNDGGFDENAWFLDAAHNNSLADPGFTTEACLAAAGPTAAVKNSGKGAFKNGAAWMEGSWINWEPD